MNLKAISKISKVHDMKNGSMFCFLLLLLLQIKTINAIEPNDLYIYKTHVTHASSNAEETYESSTGELRIHVSNVKKGEESWTAIACASMRRFSMLRGQQYVSESVVPFTWSSEGDLRIDFSYPDAEELSSLLEFLRFVHPNLLRGSIVRRHESDENYDWSSTYFTSSDDVLKRNRTNVESRKYKARYRNNRDVVREVDFIRHGTSSVKLNLTLQIPSFVHAVETIDSGPLKIRSTEHDFGDASVRVDSELTLKLARVESHDSSMTCPTILPLQQNVMIEVDSRVRRSKRQHRRSQQQQSLISTSSLTNVITPQDLINYVSTFGSFMILMEGDVIETLKLCAARAENLRDLSLFMLRGMSNEKLETLIDTTFDEVLAFDFGEVPPVQSEEDEKTVNRPLDIARDMQKYKTIGSMARVEEILSKLEEASRILKDRGTIHNNNRSQPHTHTHTSQVREKRLRQVRWQRAMIAV